VDYSAWSPEVDPFTAAKYSTRDLQGKKVCKKDLLQTFKLPSDPAAVQRPLIGIVSRFADQKGFDLIAKIAPELMKEDMAIAALGAGEPKYEQLFKELATRYPTKVSVQVKYDNVVAHKIEAGSDMFLMPSRYEPCGLNQIYSLRYGTVPIVRATGGLDDTIEPFNAKTEHGTGFKFTEYEGAALLACIREALGVYKNAVLWQILQRNGMAKDYSWGASAGTYVKVYEAAMKARNQKPAGSSN
jgi:starch synthase